jgi:mono/diheme cytochrome c family protein
MKLAVVVLAGLAIGGCGGSGGGGDKSPKGRFASLGCASCHTLKAADAHGRRGPDLDKLKPSVADVERQLADGGGGMPSFKSRLSPTEIHALAVYVAGSAGG